MDKARTARRLAVALALVGAWFLLAPRALAQLPTSEERLKILTDPESLKKKLDKEKSRPPLEMFRSQVAPFDVLPYVKRNHWSTITLELRSNYDDYAGSLETTPVALLGLPQEMVFRRDARLPKTQRNRLGLQVFLPTIPREIGLELLRPDAIRADEVWQASLRTLERHQMLALILTKEPNDAYASWNRFQAMYPHSLDRGDPTVREKQLYYRLVLPLEPDKPPLSPHPLTWTTTSHVIWDGMAPDTLNPSQQQAMLDWLHWGGQLVLVGGAGPAFSLLRDSFLSPYLPAELTGDNALLNVDDLRPLAEGYRPPFVPSGKPGDDDSTSPLVEDAPFSGGRYRPPAPLSPPANRPVFLTGLKPRPGAVGLPLGDSGRRLVGVEQRVGRGRILMLALNPTDPALASWPGLDTFLRRVVFRRPEESRDSRAGWDGRGYRPGRFGPLLGPDLSWLRFLTRDLTIAAAASPYRGPLRTRETPPPATKGRSTSAVVDEPEEEPTFSPGASVAEWNDEAAVPRLCRGLLEQASGIKIPGSWFVLKVIVAYVLCIVPLNWLVCGYLLGRRELAWLVVPLLSLAFAVGVERAAAYDMGFNTAVDEIDVVEMFGNYPRAHMSRFASLYSTGRTRFTVSYPSDPTALALPLDNGRSLRGEDVSSAVWQSYPTPALSGYLVQPRSLAFFRAEQMSSADGSVSLGLEGDRRKVINRAGFELRDAVLVDLAGPGQVTEIPLGTIGPGATVEVPPPGGAPRPVSSGPAGVLERERLLKELRRYYEDRPENAGEIRLVGWVEGPLGGQKVEPAVDRHRGFTAVVVHLAIGAPPSPDGPIYDATRPVDGGPRAADRTEGRREGEPTGPVPPGRGRGRGMRNAVNVGPDPLSRREIAPR